MKKKYVLILISLLVSFFIYLFYRTEQTVINQIVISLITYEKYIDFKNNITTLLPLNALIIYSLPEGLWVFCITLTSKCLILKIGKREIDLIYFPLIFSIGLELFQLFHLTNGRFDFWDIGFSITFWAIANYSFVKKGNNQNILNPFNTKSVVCIFSYLIVYLAHV